MDDFVTVGSDVGNIQTICVVNGILKTRWTDERIARLGFLVGLGWSGERIARDPLIRSTTNNIHRQAQRFGLRFRAASVSQIQKPIRDVLDAAAEKRGITQEKIIHLILATLAQEPNLIDNILDDAD
ncbi:hypothetical protein [Beijerinckia indica]|nr:hypothetical protein [Beijerinckia indica]